MCSINVVATVCSVYLISKIKYDANKEKSTNETQYVFQFFSLEHLWKWKVKNGDDKLIDVSNK